MDQGKWVGNSPRSLLVLVRRGAGFAHDGDIAQRSLVDPRRGARFAQIPCHI